MAQCDRTEKDPVWQAQSELTNSTESPSMAAPGPGCPSLQPHYLQDVPSSALPHLQVCQYMPPPPQKPTPPSELLWGSPRAGEVPLLHAGTAPYTLTLAQSRCGARVWEWW